MRSQLEKTHRFKKLHVKGSPLILFNIWDAGSSLANLKRIVASINLPVSFELEETNTIKVIETGTFSVNLEDQFSDRSNSN